ncbi:MAG: HD domain-containing protein [Lachnospiraceae bacterium]|nr:HD domain-containing protein [Lachnospiraceae bacterium]
MGKKNSTIDFSQSMRKDHTIEANKTLAFICRLVMIFMALIVIFAKLGCFEHPDNIYPAGFIALVVLFIPTIIYDFLELNSGLIRYFVLSLIVALIGYMYIMMGHNVVMLLAFPLVLSCLYCDIGCLLYTFVLGIPVMIFSHISAYKMGMEGAELFDDMTQVVYYGLVPRFIQYFAIACVCYGITNRIQHLFKKLTEQNNELYMDQENLVAALAGLIETQSKETGQHVRRVSEYTKVLCRALGMEEDEVWKVGLGAMMHDVGKIAVPPEILEKPGKLTEEEYLKMKWHVFYGREMLEKYPGEIMQIASIIAFQHHEHYDGTGYLGMKDGEISLYAKCVSLADFFDALVSKRVYKDAWDPEDARIEIINQKGKYFDPQLVDIFEAHYPEFLKIMHCYPDDDMPSSIEEIFNIQNMNIRK